MRSKTTTKTIGKASSLSALLDRLGAKLVVEKRPDEFTSGDVMEDRGWAISKTQRFLKTETQRGALTRRMLRGEYLYRLAE